MSTEDSATSALFFHASLIGPVEVTAAAIFIIVAVYVVVDNISVLLFEPLISFLLLLFQTLHRRIALRNEIVPQLKDES